jgi:hypothetical protein
MTALAIAPVAPEDARSDYAERINEEHRLGLERVSDAVQHFIAAGMLLIEVKESMEPLRPGEWKAWVEANFEDSYRTATRYMRLARDQHLIPSTVPSLNEAIRLLSGRPRSDSPARTLTDRQREAKNASARARRAERQRALDREKRRLAAMKRGGSVAHGYSLLRRSLEAFQKANETETDPVVRDAVETVIARLYDAEDSTKFVLGTSHGRRGSR